MDMNKDTIVNVLNVASGVCPTLLRTPDQKLVDAALAGKPTMFPTCARSIGRNYYEYEEVVLNYTGAKNEKPDGQDMNKVEPLRSGETDGIKWAYFTYKIDSSG
jgi:hypothetical protein